MLLLYFNGFYLVKGFSTIDTDGDETKQPIRLMTKGIFSIVKEVADTGMMMTFIFASSKPNFLVLSLLDRHLHCTSRQSYMTVPTQQYLLQHFPRLEEAHLHNRVRN
jgi:hypothetical protein